MSLVIFRRKWPVWLYSQMVRNLFYFSDVGLRSEALELIYIGQYFVMGSLKHVG